MLLGCLLPALVGCTQETTIYKGASLDWDVQLTQPTDTESFTLDMKYHGSEQQLQEVSFRLTSPDLERLILYLILTLHIMPHITNTGLKS